MLKKYKKLGMSAIACTLLGMGASEAAVTLTFAQTGADVTAVWSGSYLLPALDGSGFPIAGGHLGVNKAYGLPAVAYDYLSVAGVATILPGIVTTSGPYVGDSFGFAASLLVFKANASGTFSPQGTFTFANKTLAQLGVGGFNNTLAFTGYNNSGESSKIYYHTAGMTAIPEPASLFGTAGVLASGLLIRRRSQPVLF